MKIKTLIENHASRDARYEGEHGLSLLIQLKDRYILFDTGKTGRFVENAIEMGIDLSRIDTIILSHGHYDHTGGLETLLDKKLVQAKEVLVGKNFFYPKYKKITSNEYRYNGNPFNEEAIKSKIEFKELEETCYPLGDEIYVITGFKPSNKFEHYAPHFFIKKASSYIEDTFEDEIGIVIRTSRGLVLIVGCSHVGLINIIHKVKEQFDDALYGIIGGTHLVDASKDRIDQTIIALKKLNLGFLAVSHCTGEDNIEILRQAFKEKFIMNVTGHEIDLEI